MTREQFETELTELETAFRSRGPELELTVRDHDAGVEGYVVVWNTAPGKRGQLVPQPKSSGSLSASDFVRYS